MNLSLFFIVKKRIWKPLLCCLVFGAISTMAHPSGGPYGPIRQTYALPDVEGQIYYVAPDGQTDASGKTLEEPTTIESAIQQVKTGDAIVLRGGVYRTGNLILNQGITMQPYQDEEPILKGTYVATEWESLYDKVWRTSWDHFFPMQPQGWWNYRRNCVIIPLHRFNNDMVFVDGKFLQSAGWPGEVDENSYYIDYENKQIYIGVDPKDKLVEITAFNVGLLRTIKKANGKKPDKIGPTIKGITFTQYAYRALEIEGSEPNGISNEANHGKEVVGTTLENCTITYCSRVAAYLRGDKLTLRHCKVSDTSTEGIYLIASSDCLLEKNIFRRNNIEQLLGYFPAAVKIFNQCYRVTCRDNLVIEHPYSNGIWYDVGNVDGVFVDNWVQDIGFIKDPINSTKTWASQNGFFFEISKGATCAGNVFVNCEQGMWSLNSSNVKAYNNTFINSTACISRTERSAEADHFGWHPATGPGVEERIGHVFVNNLMVGDESFSHPLFFVWQAPVICDKVTDSQLAQMDNNIYVRKMKDSEHPLIGWCPAPAGNENCQITFHSPEELNRTFSQFEGNSQLFFDDSVFQSMDLGNYQLLSSFKAAQSGSQLPDAVRNLLGLRSEASFVGAYPPPVE